MLCTLSAISVILINHRALLQRKCHEVEQRAQQSNRSPNTMITARSGRPPSPLSGGAGSPVSTRSISVNARSPSSSGSPLKSAREHYRELQEKVDHSSSLLPHLCFTTDISTGHVSQFTACGSMQEQIAQQHQKIAALRGERDTKSKARKLELQQAKFLDADTIRGQSLVGLVYLTCCLSCHS